MKSKLRILFAFTLLVWLPGCGNAIDLENLSIGLVFGVDLNEHNQVVTYYGNPLFSGKTKEDIQILESGSRTLLGSRRDADTMVTGLVVGGKAQVILLGKRLLEHGDWYSLFDMYFRDAKNSLTASVVAVDGDVAELMKIPQRNAPPLFLLLPEMIDTSEKRNETVKTNLQQFDKQMLDKGITPYITVLKVENGRIRLKGAVLLDKKGKVAMHLEPNETTLLRILQAGEKGQQSLTVSIPDEKEGDIYDKNKVSFTIGRITKSTKTRYQGDQFQFDIKLNMSIALTEMLFPFDIHKNGRELEQMIQVQVKKQLEKLIKECQEKEIDPIGLGQYARAYQYKNYNKVQDRWGEAFSKADIHISVTTRIKYMGPVK